MMNFDSQKQTFANGFSMEVVSRPNFKEKFFGIMIDVGSSDVQPISGMAHFLEHQLFNKADGDLSLKFDQLGASVNAYTASNETMFYATSLNNTTKVIDLLFNLVCQPFFDEKTVAKERGIVKQELAMYQDDPKWWVINELKIQMFGKTPLGLDGLGSKTSIDSMTPKALLDFYQQEYTAQKMHFIAVGDFSTTAIKQMFTQVKKLTKDVPAGGKFQSQALQFGKLKDQEIVKPESKLFGVGLAFDFQKADLDDPSMDQAILEMMLEMQFGGMSNFYQQAVIAKVINDEVDYSMEINREGAFAMIVGISSSPKQVFTLIDDTLSSPMPDESQFNLMKKSWISHYFRLYNDLSDWAIELSESALDGENLADFAEKMNKLSFDQFWQRGCELLEHSHIVHVNTGKGGKV
ncbi:MAG: pitrilysin family protein [Lactobacillus sp.]|nr:pitrilysin family protein [Lactobacillus sp.]